MKKTSILILFSFIITGCNQVRGFKSCDEMINYYDIYDNGYQLLVSSGYVNLDIALYKNRKLKEYNNKLEVYMRSVENNGIRIHKNNKIPLCHALQKTNTIENIKSKNKYISNMKESIYVRYKNGLNKNTFIAKEVTGCEFIAEQVSDIYLENIGGKVLESKVFNDLYFSYYRCLRSNNPDSNTAKVVIR